MTRGFVQCRLDPDSRIIMTATPLKVIFLADTRPGHYHLAQGVIAAIARLRPVEVTRIEVKRKWIVPTRWLRRRINAKSFFPPRMLRMAYRIDADALPKADLVVSAGGETQMPNICVSRFLGVFPASSAARCCAGSALRISA